MNFHRAQIRIDCVALPGSMVELKCPIERRTAGYPNTSVVRLAHSGHVVERNPPDLRDGFDLAIPRMHLDAISSAEPQITVPHFGDCVDAILKWTRQGRIRPSGRMPV